MPASGNASLLKPTVSAISIPEKALLQTSSRDEDEDAVSPTTSPAYLEKIDSVPSSTQSFRPGNPFDMDLEASAPCIISSPSGGDLSASSSRPGYGRRKSLTPSMTGVPSDCQVWPTKEQWKKKAKAAKIARSCTCLARLSSRTRIVVKVLIVLFVIGVAVGVGVGISKPLGAPIWGDKNPKLR